MKERPILFSAPMVRAILEGRKSQTRCVVKPQPYTTTTAFRDIPDTPHWYGAIRTENDFGIEFYPDPAHGDWKWRCPYGVPGDRLWVRETWALFGALCIDLCLNYKADGKQRPINPHKTHADMWYPYGSDKWIDLETILKVPDKAGWQNAMFMPRWASRITLEITEVRVQRVQEIRAFDAIEEGVQRLEPPHDARDPFRELWDSINGKTYPWSSNPWVWALTFRRVS